MMISPSIEGGSVLLRAAQWVETVLQGQMITGLAVLEVLAVGLAMLGGRIPVRRGATVALGCFLAFGASAMAHGILAAATNYSQAGPVVAPAAEAPSTAFEIPSKPERPVSDDPYAGASVVR